MYQNTTLRGMRMPSRSLAFREHISDGKRFQHGQEKSLDSLHAQLQSETEKMVRWKVTTEVALDQKEKQLGESHNTITQLRSNLMEQQLSAEHLSQSLMREKCHREQVDGKVEITRHMCTALRQQQEELNNSVREFGIVKEQLTTVHDKSCSDVLSLKTCFEELTISHKQIVQDLKGKVSSEITNLRKENGNLNEKLISKSSIVEMLQEDNEKQIEKVALSENTISILENNLSVATSENKFISEQLNETSLNLANVKKELAKRSDEFEDKLLGLQISLASEKEKILKMQSEFEEAVGKIKYLKKSNDSLEGNKEELCQQLEMVNKNKIEIEQELIAAKENLNKLSCQTKLTEAVLRGQISYLEEKSCDLNSAVEVGKQKREILNSEHKAALLKLESELKCAKESFAKISKDLMEKELLVENLNQLRDEQEIKIQLLKDTLNKKENSINNLENLKHDIQIKLESANEEVLKLQMNLKESQNLFQQENNLAAELRERVEMLIAEKIKQTDVLKKSEESYNLEKKTLQEELQKMEDKNKDISEACSNSSEILKALVEKIRMLEDSLQSSTEDNASLKIESSKLQNVAKENLVELESLRNEMANLKNEHDLQRNDLHKTRDDLNLRINDTTSLQLKLESLEADLSEKQGTLEENEKELKSAEISLANELKKSEKLKARIENLEEKLKEKKSDSDTFLDQLNEKIENLVTERNDLQSLLEHIKEEAKQREKEMTDKFQEVNVSKAAAEAEALKCSVERDNAKIDCQNKIQEMVNLMESFKKNNDQLLKKKDNELQEERKQMNILQNVLEYVQLTEEQLRQKYEEALSKKSELEEDNGFLKQELMKLKLEIERLTTVKVLPSPRMKARSSSPLKTPSPGQYLPYVRNQNVANPYRSPFTDTSNIPKYDEKKIPKAFPVYNLISASPYNKVQPMDVDNKSYSPTLLKEQHPKKAVSFTSPLSCAVNDSDSSDAFVLEVGSDVDDRFDFIRRPTHVRPGIPQANVHPIPRAPTSKIRSFAKQPSSQKRVRLDKSSLKTYSSPREKAGSQVQSPVKFLRPKEKASAKRTSLDKVSFDRVFNFPE